MTELELWEKYVKTTGLGDEAKYSGNFGFEAKGFAGAERLASLLAGKKTAAFFSYATFAVDNEELPVSDERYIVCGSGREALCVIKITGVQIVPFNQVTWEMAAALRILSLLLVGARLARAKSWRWGEIILAVLICGALLRSDTHLAARTGRSI